MIYSNYRFNPSFLVAALMTLSVSCWGRSCFSENDSDDQQSDSSDMEAVEDEQPVGMQEPGADGLDREQDNDGEVDLQDDDSDSDIENLKEPASPPVVDDSPSDR